MKRTNNPNMKTWLLRISLHTFLCWSLSLWQTMPTAYADSTLEAGATTVNPGGSTTGLPSISENSGSLVQGSTSDGKQGNVVKVEGNQIKATGKFLYANVALIAVGIFTPTLVMNCWKSWSVRAFAASAALYVANEIGLFTRFNKAINKEMVAYLNRGDEDKQIHALETAAEQTRKAKKAAERRAMIAKIAAAGFGIAAGIAVAENMEWFGMTNACPPPAPPMEGVMGSPQFFDSIMNPLGLVAYTPINENLLKFYPEFGEKQFSLYRTEEKKTFNSSSDGLIADFGLHPVANERPQRRIAGGLADLFVKAVISDAHAAEPVGTERDAKRVTGKDGQDKIVVNSVGSKLGALGLGAVGGMAIVKIASGPINTFFGNVATNPLYRAVGFGIFSGVAMGASSESSGAAQKLEQRAKEYDRLADTLRNRVDQGINTETGAINQYIDQTVQGIDNKGGTIGNNEICFTGGAGQGITPDKDCGCSKTNSCAGPQTPDVTGIPKFSGSSLLVDGLNNLSAASRDLYRGDLKGATTNGQALTSNAARITKLRKALGDKLNEDRLKKGGKPIDFEKAIEAGKSRMERDIDRAFASLSPKEQSALRNMGMGGLGLDKADKEEEKGSEDLAEKTGVDTGKAVAADVNPNAGKATDKSNDGAVWDFNFEEDAAAKAQAEQEALAAALAEKEDQDYKVEGDINDDRNKNLFNIITRRYLKSAYPVIFEEQ